MGVYMWVYMCDLPLSIGRLCVGVCLCVSPTSHLSVYSLTGEVVVKWFEAVQTELPMCALGGFGATFKLPQKQVT